MRILVLSDLHLEFAPFSPAPRLDYDAVVLAGDIHNPGDKAVRWARRQSIFGDSVPIFIVLGNHEYYGRSMDSVQREMQDAVRGTNVHLLDKNAVAINGVRFVGATLWTDFHLPFSASAGSKPQADAELAMSEASRRLNDYRLIRVQREEQQKHVGAAPQQRSKKFRLLTPTDTQELHAGDRRWLSEALDTPHDGPTVVVTHHAPSLASVSPKFAGDSLNPSFASELPAHMFRSADLWIHGHMHCSADYLIEGCRVVCNPRGYPIRWNDSFENPWFDPFLVIDLAV